MSSKNSQNERRKNWKTIIPENDEITIRRQNLFNDLEKIKEQLKNVGVDFKRYDELKLQEREITAKIITL